MPGAFDPTPVPRSSRRRAARGMRQGNRQQRNIALALASTLVITGLAIGVTLLTNSSASGGDSKSSEIAVASQLTTASDSSADAGTPSPSFGPSLIDPNSTSRAAMNPTASATPSRNASVQPKNSTPVEKKTSAAPLPAPADQASSTDRPTDGCTSASLALTYLGGSAGAGGQFASVYAIRNTSSAACTLRTAGFTVSLPRPAGSSADMTVSGPGSGSGTLALAPGSSAHFLMQTASGEVASPPQNCGFTSVVVTLPEGAGTLQANATEQRRACTAQVEAIQPGEGRENVAFK